MTAPHSADAAVDRSAVEEPGTGRARAVEEPGADRARAVDWMAPLAATTSMVVIFVALLAVPVQVASDRELSPAQTGSWIMALFGIPAVLSLLLIWRYRQPLVLTGNVFVWIYLVRLGSGISWSDLVGASMLAGVIVTTLGPLRLTRFLTRWLPSSIVSALLAGAVLGFFIDLFSALNRELVLVGATLVAYLLARSVGRAWLPPMLPALAAGLAVAATTGQLHSVPGTSVLPAISLTWPTFSLTAIATVTPVVVLLMTLPTNIPSMVLLENHGYQPPKGVIGAVSGLSTIAGSLLGPSATSLSLPGVAICVAPETGERRLGPHVAAMASIGGLAIAVLGGVAAHTATIVPRELLVAAVGLAVVGIVANSLGSATRGPLLLGPLFTFAIAMSDMSLLGLGSFPWAIGGGITVSLLLERKQFLELASTSRP
ncbi:MAG: benzoate/H(+) symporter BenE family transporter [Acidimicrobiales bacterium]